MMRLCCDVLDALRAKGLTLATAESLTGGGIGAALTAIPGASDVFKGGIISYVDQVKAEVLGVSRDILEHNGAVSAQTAEAMAAGARKLLSADTAVSVTGLAGPGSDDFGNPVGTVFIGFSSRSELFVEEYHFVGNREQIRSQTILAALRIVLNHV